MIREKVACIKFMPLAGGRVYDMHSAFGENQFNEPTKRLRRTCQPELALRQPLDNLNYDVTHLHQSFHSTSKLDANEA